MEAQEWCHRYKVSGNVRDLNQAWDLYYHVFRRISRQLPQLTSLELQYVSPKLLLCRDLELAVPGSYIPGQPVVRIAQIQSSLQVITSKQRPRKLCIKGNECLLHIQMYVKNCLRTIWWWSCWHWVWKFLYFFSTNPNILTFMRSVIRIYWNLCWQTSFNAPHDLGPICLYV